ncbi:uncharacterized protein [Chelonus insularis]|uniref:uncharacterized protein isoform X1 n=1 Tax=Chelonus insularis TaxID=460826 RepID=UPI001589BB88|nr:uncharacterized protein LOC118066965 isoform X1 [Chelonus insularis]
MDQLCPLCQKAGYDRKIKTVQINYEEALKMCESETCPWPFGYEELQYIPQKADFLDIQPETTNEQKSNDLSELTMSIDLSMYTPPLTPKGDYFTSPTTISSNSDISNSLSTLNSYMKKENDKDQIVKKDQTLPTLQSIFDIDTKKNNTSLEMKYQEKIFDHKTNHVKSKEPKKSHLRIRSVEKVHVQLKPKNYSHIISGKHNTKPTLKIIYTKELNEKIPIKNITSSCKSVVKSAISQSLAENDLNRQNLDQQLIKDYEYNQVDITKSLNRSFESNQNEKQLNNFDKTSEQIINNDEYMSSVQNTKLSTTSDQRDMSSISPVSIDHFLDEILLDGLNSTPLTENIDDDWLKSLI